MPENKGISSQEEYDLLQQARQLEEGALTRIFDEYYEPIYRYVYRHMGVAQVAEDLVAEVFHSFLEELKMKRGPSTHLRAWLYRVAHNMMVDEIRRNKRRIHETLDEESSPGVDGGMSDRLQQSMAQQFTQQALEQLTDKQRDVLVLRYIQGLEIEEVATTLNMTTGTVKSLQHRGLEAMRRYLNGTDIQNEMDL
jgi:RNA polymerase sigma-70 factor (ECF subfamily)